MKRRQIIRSLISLPAITALPGAAQQAPTDKTKPQAGEKLPPEMKPQSVEEIPTLALTPADAAIAGTPGFFSEQQLVTLRALAAALVPPVAGKPGAADAAVPEFLDFLIGHSPEDRQILYRAGLDRLESESRQRFGAGFVSLSVSQVGSLLASLREPWTFRGPSDDLARFLIVAKEDVLRATVNSREWAAVSGRRASGLGTYWYPVE